MVYSVAWGRLIHEKNRSRKSRDTVPLRRPGKKPDSRWPGKKKNNPDSRRPGKNKNNARKAGCSPWKAGGCTWIHGRKSFIYCRRLQKFFYLFTVHRKFFPSF